MENTNVPKPEFKLPEVTLPIPKEHSDRVKQILAEVEAKLNAEQAKKVK